MGLLDTFRQLLETIQEPEIPPLQEQPEYVTGLQRGVVTVDAPIESSTDKPSLDQARNMLAAGMREYLEADIAPMLLVKAAPGVGKTTAAVRLAEELAMQGRRVLYAGPRHELFKDIQALAEYPSMWYEWLPRQAASGDKPETCMHAENIGVWMGRGYKGMDFCKQICGWDYVNNSCPYHAQKRRIEPIIYGQHQHVSLGHPLDFDVLIGDEYPVPTFCYKYFIPASDLLLRDIDDREPVADILLGIKELAEKDFVLHGEEMIRLLGGGTYVHEACRTFSLPVSADLLCPTIYNADQARTVPHAYIFQLLPLLQREAKAVMQGMEYPHRIRIGSGKVELWLRHSINENMPQRIIWLDATANQHVYEAVFERRAEVLDAYPQRKGHVYQITDRANGKTTLDPNVAGGSRRLEQTERVVQHIIESRGYKRPAIISYKKTIDAVESFKSLDNAHYYGARGTNALEGCDALFVVGTPMPPIDSIVEMAHMVFFDRMTPFNKTWASSIRGYNCRGSDGEWKGHETSAFLADADLDSLLWGLRNAEIIQAVHRARIINHEVDVWLLANTPIEELPPDKLYSIQDVLGAPEGVDVFEWLTFWQFAEEYKKRGQCLTSVDVIDRLGITKPTAIKYIKALITDYGWSETFAARPPGAKGRRMTAAQWPESIYHEN